MDTIFIKNIKVDAIIGVYPDERTTKQPLNIDIEMLYDAQQAIASDNLAHALDYHKIYSEMIEYISRSSFQLIEALAGSVSEKILRYHHKVVEVKVTVSKPNALEHADTVGICVVRSNNC